ncbi:MAG: hypothetical protein V4533_16805 [Pseudomonadota bacterium]
MTHPTFKRGQRVLYTRSVLCGREPEYGVIVRRYPESAGMPDAHWYVVRDEKPHPYGYGNAKFDKTGEHASMLVPA